MGFLQMMTALAVLAAIAVPSLAKDIYVGDGYGWRLNFDYQAWAKGKEFYVGDRLIFVYPKGAHNVLKVGNGYDFQKCAKPFGVSPFTSGYDVITLATPGTKWYLCGVANHCSYGMKLVINVSPKKEGYEHKAPSHSYKKKESNAPYSKKQNGESYPKKEHPRLYPKKNYNSPYHA